METFKECRRKWWLQYVRKLRHKTDPDSGRAARIGTLFHEIMETYYGGHQTEEAQREAIANLVPPPLATPDDLKEYDLARTIAEGYFQWVAEEGVDADLEFEAVEEKIQTPSPIAGVDLLGKADLLATKKSSGERVVVDHKTTGSFARSLSDIHLLRQPKLYSLIRRIKLPDDPLHGVMWNMARTVGRGKTAKPPFYMRYELATSEAELRRYWRELGRVIQDMLDLEQKIESTPVLDRSVVAYPSPSKDCSWKCPFYAVCGYLDDPKYDSEGLLEEMYETYDPLERYEEEDHSV